MKKLLQLNYYNFFWYRINNFCLSVFQCVFFLSLSLSLYSCFCNFFCLTAQCMPLEQTTLCEIKNLDSKLNSLQNQVLETAYGIWEFNERTSHPSINISGENFLSLKKQNLAKLVNSKIIEIETRLINNPSHSFVVLIDFSNTLGHWNFINPDFSQPFVFMNFSVQETGLQSIAISDALREYSFFYIIDVNFENKINMLKMAILKTSDEQLIRQSFQNLNNDPFMYRYLFCRTLFFGLQNIRSILRSAELYPGLEIEIFQNCEESLDVLRKNYFFFLKCYSFYYEA